jgi:uncharacterized coiled-coil protein SlyX
MAWSDWISIVALAMSIVGPLALYLLRSLGKNEAEEVVADLRTAVDCERKRIDDLATRVVKLEERDASGPQREDIVKLSAQLAEISGDMKAMKAEVHALSKSVALINETMLSANR